MDKQTFLSALRSGLDFLPEKERDEVVAEFEEHFEVGVERGHSERTLLDQLGDPAGVIEAYRMDAMNQGGVSFVNEPKTREHEKPIVNKSQTSGDRYVNIHEKYAAADIRKVTIRLVDSNILFDASGSDITLDIEGPCGCDYSVDLSDGELVIEQKARFLRFLRFSRDPDVHLKLPQVFKGKIDAESTSGDVSISSFKGNKLKVHTVSGDFWLGELYVAGNAEISSISGDIKGGRVMADELNMRSTSGDVKLDLVTAEKLSFQTVSGDIQTKLTDSWKNMTFNSISGDVKLRLPEGGAPFDVQMSSMSGSVKNELGRDPAASRVIRMKSVSGDVKIKRA